MNNVSDYTRKINSFGKSIEKMLTEDFPEKEGLHVQLESSLAQIQFIVLSAFMEKGGRANG